MDWREVSHPFNQLAGQYDSWYDDNPAFGIELAALQATPEKMPLPRLEIGVGPGRFAQALQTEFGLDPAISPLQLASRRSIMTVNGVGEYLPVRSHSIGTVYLLFTFCFLVDPVAVVRECSRILLPGGRLIIGLIPAASPWGQRLAELGRSNHPYYRHARLRTIAETTRLLAENGFHLHDAWSTLFQPPDRELRHESPIAGTREDAGFCVLITCKEGECA